MKVSNGEEGIEYSGNISEYQVFLNVEDGIQIPGEGGDTPFIYFTPRRGGEDG